VGLFRIAKQFEIEAGHRLSKHPEKCRFPHGHSYTIEVVVRASGLDGNDMVCDYKALKIVVQHELERIDHAMLLGPDDAHRDGFAPFSERVVVLAEGDPTTEIIARDLFRRLCSAFRPGMTVTSPGGAAYLVPAGLEIERVRVWETSTTWAEYSEEAGAGSRAPGSEA
jgi:6-pyruvoyltetrahydropterin/6-carboxytetrahydropterin synthase